MRNPEFPWVLRTARKIKKALTQTTNTKNNSARTSQHRLPLKYLGVNPFGCSSRQPQEFGDRVVQPQTSLLTSVSVWVYVAPKASCRSEISGTLYTPCCLAAFDSTFFFFFFFFLFFFWGGVTEQLDFEMFATWGPKLARSPPKNWVASPWLLSETTQQHICKSKRIPQGSSQV